MATPNPQPGERWRVTIEGEVQKSSANDLITLSSPHGENLIYIDEGTWERLPDPEPEWGVGDLVLDADGAAWRRREEGWWLMGAFGTYADAKPTRPLRRLVVEGDTRG